MLDKHAFTTEFIRLTKVIYSVVFKSHGELNVQINLQQNDFDKLHINSITITNFAVFSSKKEMNNSTEKEIQCTVLNGFILMVLKSNVIEIKRWNRTLYVG